MSTGLRRRRGNTEAPCSLVVIRSEFFIPSVIFAAAPGSFAGWCLTEAHGEMSHHPASRGAQPTPCRRPRRRGPRSPHDTGALLGGLLLPRVAWPRLRTGASQPTGWHADRVDDHECT